MSTADLPTVNAVLNAVSAVFLVTGYIKIRKGFRNRHKKFMLSALVSSAAFLISYLVYHYRVGSVPYRHHDWTRPLYYGILVPHIVLAAVMIPFIVAALIYALKADFIRHKRLTRWVWPVWIFVCVTGIAVYLMLYRP